MRRFFKEMMHFHYNLYLNTIAQKPAAPGVMKFTIWIDPSLDIINIYPVS